MTRPSANKWAFAPRFRRRLSRDVVHHAIDAAHLIDKGSGISNEQRVLTARKQLSEIPIEGNEVLAELRYC